MSLRRYDSSKKQRVGVKEQANIKYDTPIKDEALIEEDVKEDQVFEDHFTDRSMSISSRSSP